MTLVNIQVNDQFFKMEPPVTPLSLLTKSGGGKRNGDLVVGARLEGLIVDLNRALPPREELYRLDFIDTSSEEGLEILRHSTSHVMTQAVKRLFGDRVQLGVGPATKDGFYQDYDLPELSEDDLPLIEEEMHRIIDESNEFIRTEVPKEEALRFFGADELKRELIGEIPSETVTVYRQREYLDLCRGPHVPNSSMLGVFKLLRVSGAYWRGDSRRKQLKRIYGVAFPTRELLEQELKRRAEALRRDHRRLGAELDLFVFSDLAPGAPVFLPAGTVLYNNLVNLKRELMRNYEYVEVRTPTILNRKLWETSGHWEHYRENMFTLTIDEDDYAVKPMNCPGSTIVFQSRPRSYRELPLRLGEFGYVHRNELSGVLTGLLRVRAFTQDDAHLYVRPDQIEDEVARTIRMFQELYDIFGFKTRIALSTRPENRMGEESLWDIAETALTSALTKMNVHYEVKPGDGAFYGPKIDFHIEDCLGREWQCGTCQLDFQLPEKFDLHYVTEDGTQDRPVIIHPAAMGSIERFMAICIEEFDGHFPTWLSPVQVLILPVSNKALAYAEQVGARLAAAGIKAEIDRSTETLGKKIRNAHGRRAPYMLIVGPKEAELGTVSVRDRLEQEQRGVNLKDFVELVTAEIAERLRQPYLVADFAPPVLNVEDYP
jgi:threonyl-tRNA synthetase